MDAAKALVAVSSVRTGNSIDKYKVHAEPKAQENHHLKKEPD
jgi:hypothetical protein